MDDGSDHKKAKGTKKCVTKQKLIFACLIIKLYIDHRKDLKSFIMLCTQKKYKIVLSSNDDKRLRASDKITTYPYGTSEMMMINK